MKLSKNLKIIIKFLNKEANHNELEKLDVWLRDPDNVKIFNQYVKIQYLTTICMAKYDLYKAKESINQKVKRAEKKRRLGIYKRISIAASLLILLSLPILQALKKEPVEEQVVLNPNEIQIGSDKAILTLENGGQVALEKGKNFQKGTVNSNGEQLVYSQKKEKSTKKRKPSYNYLTIPRGGQFFVRLSDGTSVWLNSESKLKYPTSFYEGETREVELVYGEAYFEVSPSTEHKGAGFNVITNGQTVNVLGTEFNVSAYIEENEVITTLVGGKITVQKGESKEFLRPNQQSKINKTEDSIQVVEVDASREISWVKGVFSFDEEPLDEIMKVLSRWYDIEVVFESAESKDFSFTGILERAKSFDDILALIEATSEKEVSFEIENKTVFIK